VAILVSSSDGDRDELSIGILSAPYNTYLLDHGDGTAEFGFAPSVPQAGPHIIRLIVQDTSLSDTAEFSILATPIANRAPRWLDYPVTINVFPSDSGSTLPCAVDPDSTVPSLEMLDGPAFASLADHADGTATLTIAPTVADTGTYTIHAQATDGELSLTRTVWVIVPGRGETAPDTPGASLKAQLAAAFDVAGFADMLQAQDLDGDGLDEITFRRTSETSGQELVIWEPLADSLWVLPEFTGTLRGYSFRSGKSDAYNSKNHYKDQESRNYKLKSFHILLYVSLSNPIKLTRYDCGLH